MTLNGNSRYREFPGNTALASVIVNGNISTLLVPPENRPSTELESNHITGNLTRNGNIRRRSTTANRMSPAVAGNGQCTGL